jgi:hypothetical protein
MINAKMHVLLAVPLREVAVLSAMMMIIALFPNGEDPNWSTPNALLTSCASSLRVTNQALMIFAMMMMTATLLASLPALSHKTSVLSACMMTTVVVQPLLATLEHNSV